MLKVSNLKVFESADIASLVVSRSGEQKLGQAIARLDDVNPGKDIASLKPTLVQKVAQGARYILIGVPEDIGPRANCGRGGSDSAWEAFISHLVNVQVNRFVDPQKLLVLGSVDVDDLTLQAKDLDNTKDDDIKKLRTLCAELDKRIAPIIELVSSVGLEPIIVGGGHNNVYPIHKGIAAAQRALGTPTGIASINCDPHADFRAIEGRHSGNGFSYSHQDGILKAYYVLGLHEPYNSEDILERLNEAGFQYSTYEDLKIRGKFSWQTAVEEGVAYLNEKGSGFPKGIGLDADSIAFLPVSAETPNGLTNEETAYYLYSVASSFKEIAYLHLPEGAPALHYSEATGSRYVGRTLVNQVLAYVKGREERA